MAKTYRTPGVYVEEISIFPPSVAQVETAIPAFIGYTEKADKDTNSLVLEPTRITSLLEYETYFGKALNEANITVTIDDEIDSTGPTLLNRKISVAEGSTQPYLMHYAMRMYFDNGGGPCYITSVGDYTASISLTDLTNGLNAVKAFDEPTLFVFPDAINIGTAANYYTLINRAMTQCVELGDRFTIIDMHGNDSANLRSSNTLGSGTDLLKYGASYHPFLKTVYNYAFDAADVTIAHNTVDESATVGTGQFDGDNLSDLEDSTSASFDLVTFNQIKLEINKKTVTLPPSCAMAGIYAKVDSSRGVWKAPANVSVSSCLEPTIKITHEQQEGLNIDTSGKSINAIRTFAGKGVMVWGARTLAGNDNEWRYVPVRRFFNMVEESVKKATEQFVFEPNDANTWIKVRAMIENFLTLQWRAGALAGAKPEQAFYVRVALGETMTALDILEGRMNVEIGMAVVRPAEFIILKFSHKMQEA
ncbi:phage tail sheath family protein [Hwangdonia lutea]|uniref:Phage tail sheath family protein n=1 Tax=Hwangdonia lutea TaxID=3075823 RepID=A0AA97EKR5_9FLAO|nr:phage tail sheath family protein [Hwangdonia sp. SCSIO 19198]WOD42831.1 phage tail sheath family protein [Hwangdonia sp. SCSIO 19198]